MASEKHPKGGRIYERGRKWWASCYVNGVEKVRPGGTKYEALRVLKELQRERDEGRDYVPLGDILTAYMQNVAARRKKNTLRAFREGERILLDRFGRGFCVHDLTIEKLNKMLADRAKTRAPITANKPCKVLRAALHHAITAKKLKGMPCKVPLLTEVKKKPRILTVRQFKKVRDAAKHKGARLAIVLAYQAGLRHDEIVHLRIKDITYDPAVTQLGKFEVSVRAWGGWTPKSHAERSVPLAESCASAIWSYLADHEFAEDRDAPLIYWGVNKPHRYRDLYVQVREAFQAARLWDVDAKSGLHMCRRTFASHLLSGGVDLKTVMELGGWSSIEAVQRYLASTDELKVGAVDKLEVD